MSINLSSSSFYVDCKLFFLFRRNSPPPLICFGLLAIFLLVLFCSLCCFWMRCGVFVFLVIMIVFCLISTIWLDANWPRFYHKFSAVCDIVVFSQFSLLLVTSCAVFIVVLSYVVAVAAVVVVCLFVCSRQSEEINLVLPHRCHT